MTTIGMQGFLGSNNSLKGNIEPVMTTQVSMVIDQLDCSRSALDEAVSVLIEKLSSVVRDEPDARARDENTAEQKLVPLAHKVRAQIYGLESIREKICSVIERIELA